MRFSFILTVLLACASFSVQASVQVLNVRMWPAPDNTRLVLDLSGPVEHSLFTLKNPNRIVLDVKGARMAASLDMKDLAKSFLSGVRFGRRGKNDLRIDRKSTRLNSSHIPLSRMPSSA